MSYRIPDRLKKLVATRAGFRCEYCRTPESESAYRFHFEHIIALQHGGQTNEANLAYACSCCNWKKGPNLATILAATGLLVRLFHPRKDNWFDHFELQNGMIYAKTDIGDGTIKLLELNQPDTIIERAAMEKLGLIP